MADHAQTATADGHPDMDYAEHHRTYDRFIAFSKWTIVAIIVILALMAFFLV
ncbi:aa3-type cytochrome c oxidase subunit IV [Chelatococcus reniformis]|uniref:Cytochrome c oxidase subunit IV bacterial aa3 type domain-containing protein n=1 Tax=Chelatococcus reniformis TaxID=1494448 RepID=A0A916XE84_9HYPH|nr:aa3-type cytochrome c oxidase subunit IV [Chelatococcus reniformis]GGC64052.1 hypothetical protein GCM10010994_23350 [Chelatococcus reniformis]